MAILNTPLLGLPYAGADTDETYDVLAGLFVKDGQKLTLPEIVDNYTPTIGTVYIEAADWTAADGTADAYDAKITISGVEPNSMILIYPATDSDAEKAKRLGIRAKAASGVVNDDTFVIVRATGGDTTVTDGIVLVYIALRGYAVWSAGITPPFMPYATVIGVDPYIATEEGDRDDIAASQRLVTEAFTELRISLSTLFTGLADTNKALELRLKSADLQTKLDEYRAAKGLIDKTVSDLANYYTKFQTLTKDEINALVSAIPKFKIEVVTSLPASNISETTVYLVKSGADSSNLYTEYIRVNGAWERLGTQTVDLTGYATEAWVNGVLAYYVKTVDMEAYVEGLLNGYVPKEEGKGLSTNDYTDAERDAVAKAVFDSATAKQTADSANETALAVRAAKDRGELDGKDGKSPTVTVSKVGSATTITATNPDGTTFAEQVQDGITQAEVLYVDTVADLAGETIDKSKVYVCIEDNKQYGFKMVEVVTDSGDLMQTAVMGSGTHGWTTTTVTDTGYDGDPILDEDGNPAQVTVGYNKGRRLSGDNGSSQGMATVNHSGFIEVTDDDVVTIRNMVGVAATNLYAIVYDDNFAKIGKEKRINATNPDGPPIALDGVWSLNTDGSITTVDTLSKLFGATGIKYIRFSFGLATLPSLHVKPTVEHKAKWAAIRDWPADRSEDISELSEEVNKHDVRLYRLEQGMAGKPQTQDAAIQLMRTWDKPINDTAPVVLIEGDTKPAVGNRTTLTAIYAAYDKLVTDYPLYVTKTNLGKDAGGTLDIHRYDICAPTPHENSDGDHPAITRPKIILISGIHTEWMGIWSLYHAVEEVLTNPAFADIKRNVHLIVVPACNPYCLDEATRGNSSGRMNANGVEIHRNFTIGWADNPNPEGNEHWGGTKELSEAESRYIDAIMAENTDAVAFVSCHNFDQGGGGDYGTTFMWASTATAYLHNLGGRFGVKMSDAWEAKYGDTWRANINANKTSKQPAGDYTVGMAGVSKTEGGTEARQGMLYGIQGMTFEVGGDMVALNTNGANAVCVTRGAEVYANLIKTLLADYDHHDKAEYAPIMPADLS